MLSRFLACDLLSSCKLSRGLAQSVGGWEPLREKRSESVLSCGPSTVLGDAWRGQIETETLVPLLNPWDLVGVEVNKPQSRS